MGRLSRRGGVSMQFDYVTDPVWGSVMSAEGLVVTTHAEALCEGRVCAIHNPSNHHMRDWPVTLRLDRNGLLERQCPHGQGHPDPDSVAHFEAQGDETAGYHGCDGCCQPPESAHV